MICLYFSFPKKEKGKKVVELGGKRDISILGNLVSCQHCIKWEVLRTPIFRSRQRQLAPQALSALSFTSSGKLPLLPFSSDFLLYVLLNLLTFILRSGAKKFDIELRFCFKNKELLKVLFRVGFSQPLVERMNIVQWYQLINWQLLTLCVGDDCCSPRGM